MVAGGEGGDAFADRLDNTCAFVAEDGRRVAGRVGSGGGVEIGVADPACFEAHQNLSRAGS